MQCPYCQTPLQENIRECPNCLLSLYMANSLLAPVPKTNAGLNDFLEILNSRDKKKINRAIKSLSRTFPQVRMHILIRKFSIKFSFSTNLFWLLNRCNFSKKDSSSDQTHTILIGLDPEAGKVGLTVGYGLEKFLPKELLHRPLENAQQKLAEGHFAEAIITIITDLKEAMQQACLNANNAPALT